MLAAWAWAPTPRRRATAFQVAKTPGITGLWEGEFVAQHWHGKKLLASIEDRGDQTVNQLRKTQHLE